MKAIILALIPIIAVAVGVLVGRRAASPSPKLSKSDQRELEWLRGLREELIASASEHATLGDDFAVIALGMMRRPTKELP